MKLKSCKGKTVVGPISQTLNGDLIGAVMLIPNLFAGAFHYGIGNHEILCVHTRLLALSLQCQQQNTQILPTQINGHVLSNFWNTYTDTV
jgi:hypothetical protein